MLNKTGKLQTKPQHNRYYEDPMEQIRDLEFGHTFFYFNKDRRTKSERWSPAFGNIYLFSLQGKLRSCFLTAHDENEERTWWMSWWRSGEN